MKDYCNLLREREQVHNIIADVKEVEGYLQYEDGETRILAEKLQKVLCHVQMHLLPPAIKVYGPAAKQAGKSEVRQLHDCTCF